MGCGEDDSPEVEAGDNLSSPSLSTSTGETIPSPSPSPSSPADTPPITSNPASVQSPFTITSPNGGESWQIGSSHTITWTSNNITSIYVKIDLYNNGSYYTSIDKNELNDGSYTWTIPTGLNPSNSYQVRITDTSNPSVYDTSNNTFSLTPQPSITVTSPGSGESWKPGSAHLITWTSSHISGNVKIDLYRNGNYYATIAGSEPNDGRYTWTIPTGLALSNSYQVRITDTDNPAVYDATDNYFSLATQSSSITVTSPNSGESWQLGSSHAITWTRGTISSNVKIDLYYNGSYYATIAGSEPNDGSYIWTIPTGYAPFHSYQVRITALNNPAVYDTSDKNFSLATQSSSITVTSPNGGENWALGSSYAITWTSTNIGAYVKIDLYRNGSYYTAIHGRVLNDGNYTWTIPTGLAPSNAYQVRITALNDPALSDASNKNFSLTAQSAITVISPNGGESWQLGSSHTITWTKGNSSSNVKIDLYNNGGPAGIIVDSTPNDGSYTWAIPTGLALSDSYQVRITALNNPALYDVSDNYFSVAAQASITVISPNGGESWQLGSSHAITWTSDNISGYVKIDLYYLVEIDNNSVHYATISGSEPNDGSYTWIIPPGLDPSNHYQVQITVLNNSSLYDTSNNYFSLTPQ